MREFDLQVTLTFDFSVEAESRDEAVALLKQELGPRWEWQCFPDIEHPKISEGGWDSDISALDDFL